MYYILTEQYKDDEVIHQVNTLTETVNNETTDNEAVLDSGASHNYLKLNSPCYEIKPTLNSISVSLPNKKMMKSTHEATLPMSQLSTEARTAHIFPNLIQSALISITQLCDNGCKVIFSKRQEKIYKNNTLILTGKRNTKTRM